jgi:hypothetical protein
MAVWCRQQLGVSTVVVDSWGSHRMVLPDGSVRFTTHSNATILAARKGAPPPASLRCASAQAAAAVALLRAACLTRRSTLATAPLSCDSR